MYVLSFSYFGSSFNLHTDSHINFNDLWNQSQNLILEKPLYTSTETQTILFTRKLLCRRQTHAWDPRILVQAIQTLIESLRFTYTNHLSWVEIHTIPDSPWGCSFNKSLLAKLQELSIEYTTIAQNTAEFVALTPSCKRTMIIWSNGKAIMIFTQGVHQWSLLKEELQTL